MEIIDHTLQNGLALTLRVPERTTKRRYPVVILCHGFGGIRDVLLPAFADVFARAGFAAITFDYTGFGDSRGERGRLLPAIQVVDILEVLSWARQQPELDSARMALWGTSLGGGHVFAVAAIDQDIKCIVSQLPFADGEALIIGKLHPQAKRDFIHTLDKLAHKQQTTGKEMFVSMTRVLNDPESLAFFNEYRLRYPKLDIKIPFLTIREILQYKPLNYAAQVKCPTMVVVAGKDIVNPPEHAIKLYEMVASRDKVLYEEPEARHYDLYSGENFERVSSTQTAWFLKHL